MSAEIGIKIEEAGSGSIKSGPGRHFRLHESSSGPAPFEAQGPECKASSYSRRTVQWVSISINL